MQDCFCGSKSSFHSCCEPYILGEKAASTPEKLMRSRYSAYAIANTEYIKQTMQGKALLGYNVEDSKKWASKVIWLGLQVHNAYFETKEKGFVEFSAKLIDDGRLHEIHELSEFSLIDGLWFYIQGTMLPASDKLVGSKISRNSLCLCGSKKKFKSCHGRAQNN
ncbi:MAG: YchJ family metal-binding protein [Legionellaceae bacterium]|nr:YchJ family metal-binding protein [Legionellaceae bacterium]